MLTDPGVCSVTSVISILSVGVKGVPEMVETHLLVITGMWGEATSYFSMCSNLSTVFFDYIII